MRIFLNKLGVVLCIAGGAICAAHLATFVTHGSMKWIYPPFALLFAAAFCLKAVEPQPPSQAPSRNWRLFRLALVVYGILTFLYAYRASGGASSVGIVEGKYVVTEGSQVVRTMSEQEYRTFWNLWTRASSAWIGMLAVVFLVQFPRPVHTQEK